MHAEAKSSFAAVLAISICDRARALEAGREKKLSSLVSTD